MADNILYSGSPIDAEVYDVTIIKGDKGDKGDLGPTPVFSIGEVTTLEYDQPASANISGTAEQPVLNLGIPVGKDAYTQAVEGGYTGGEAEFNSDLANFKTYATTAESAKGSAETAATNAAASASAAAASATAAAGSASDAADDADRAEQAESDASGYATNAAASASSAASSAGTATTKAGEAAQSATAASQSASSASSSATAASGSASEAAGSATNASNSATSAATSATAASTAKTAAETAQGKAEDAQDAAETAASSVSASAAQIATNTADISDLRSAFIDSVDIQYGGKGNAPLIWELGAINNQGAEEDNTTMVRTGFYLMRKGDSFKCSRTNLRVFYYTLDGTFKSTLYSVIADQDYVATESVLVRFRAGYTASYGSYNYYNAYLTLSIESGLLYEPYLEVYKRQSYLNDALFEIGGISVVNGAYAYASAPNRVRTKEGVSFHLKVGDIVSFESPVTRFCPFYSVNGGTVTQVGWQYAAYTVSTEGDYTFVLSSIQSGSEVTPSSTAEFSRAISIVTSEQINDVCIWDAIGEADNIARDAGGAETDSAITAIVNSVNQAVDGNDLVFVHITDSHVGQSAMPLDRAAKHFAKAMDVAKAVGADFLIHTGDMIQGNGSIAGDNDRQRYGAYMGKVGRYVTPFMWCQGNPNHDYGVSDSDSATGYTLDRDIVLALAGRFGKWNTFTANYNDNDTIRSYYYFDIPVQQTRIIVLDSDDYGGNRQGWGYNAIQISWLETVLNDAITKNLPVVLFSHMPPSNNLMPSGVENTGGSGIMSALATFTSNGGTVLAFIYGHVHWDNYYNDAEHGVPYISCTCDLPVASTETYVPTWGTKVVPARTIGSLTEYAFDVYVINPKTKATKIFRYGAGSNRSYTY